MQSQSHTGARAATDTASNAATDTDVVTDTRTYKLRYSQAKAKLATDIATD